MKRVHSLADFEENVLEKWQVILQATSLDEREDVPIRAKLHRDSVTRIRRVVHDLISVFLCLEHILTFVLPVTIQAHNVRFFIEKLKDADLFLEFLYCCNLVNLERNMLAIALFNLFTITDFDFVDAALTTGRKLLHSFETRVSGKLHDFFLNL